MFSNKGFILLLLFIFVFKFCFSQDIHFSQFYNSPLTLNPALTGNFSGEWRITNHFRNQWMALPNPFRTITAGFDRIFYNNNDIIGAGIYIVNDQSGSINLNVNKIFLSGSYKKYLYNYYVAGGIQVGYVNKTIDFNSLSFPSQYDHSIGDFNLQFNNNESGNYDQASYLDVNTGLSGNTIYRNLKIDAGLAFYHVNFPKENFTGGETRLPMRSVFHSSVTIDMESSWFLKPQIMTMFHKKANDLIVGSDIGLSIANSPFRINRVFAGCYFRDGISRNSESFIITLGSGWHRLQIGLSYDFRFRIIKPATGDRGSFEISLIYTSFNTVPQKITIPCNQN